MEHCMDQAIQNELRDSDHDHLNKVIFQDSIQSAITPSSQIELQDDLDSNSHVDVDISNMPKKISNDSELSTTLPTDASFLTDDSISDESDRKNKTFKLEDNKLCSPDFSDDFEGFERENQSQTTEPSSSQENSQGEYAPIFKELEKVPHRMAFKIGEVALLTGVKSYVLRYWESEFEALKPKKAHNNRRMYTQKDIRTILLIKKLLYKDKYSIEGAQKALRTVQTEFKGQSQIWSLSCKQQKAITDLKSLIGITSRLKEKLNIK